MQGMIAEAYFQRLLCNTPPLEAVATLAQFWSHRLDDRLAQWGVSLPEYQAQLILVAAGEIGNGGHVQFFMNRGDAQVAATVVALQAAQLTDWADILCSAQGIIAGKDIAALPAKNLARLHDLDLHAYATLGQVHDHILALLRAGADKVLLPERGL